MANNNLKFWLLTYDYFKKDIKKLDDNVIILVHWLLLKNDFQVLGPGSENEIAENEQPTDFLPANWSENVTSYYIRYTRNKTLFLLNGVKAGDNSLIFNFYNVTTKHVSSAALGDIKTMVLWMNDVNDDENFHKTINLLQQDLIDSMKIENDDKRVASTQTSVQSESTSIIQHPSLRRVPFRHSAITRHSLDSYGISDLNPLGGLHSPIGGMLFDPLRSNRLRNLPRGVPPMARYDPMRPHIQDPMMPERFGRLNPDHLTPPDFDDDMYM